MRYRLIRSLISASSWQVSPWAVHSYYSLRHHMVVFPAGMFRSPFFHMEFPRYEGAAKVEAECSPFATPCFQQESQ